MTRRKTHEQSPMARPPRPARLLGARQMTLAAAAGRATKRSPAPKTGVAKSMQLAPASKPGREDPLERLANAEAKVKDLEGRLAAVTDRIAWITDRLHSLLELHE